MDLLTSRKQIKAWQSFIGATPDGAWGKQSKRLTIAFQAKAGLREDGRVGKNTLAAASALSFKLPHDAKAVVHCLPPVGVGYTGYNRDGRDQFGTARTIAFIEELGRAWALLDTKVLMQIGDISRENGADFRPDHKGHRRGNEFDMRPFRKDGKLLRVSCDEAEYDPEMTAKFVALVKKMNPKSVIFFNDVRLTSKNLTRHLSGHFNHLHIRIG